MKFATFFAVLLLSTVLLSAAPEKKLVIYFSVGDMNGLEVLKKNDLSIYTHICAEAVQSNDSGRIYVWGWNSTNITFANKMIDTMSTVIHSAGAKAMLVLGFLDGFKMLDDTVAIERCAHELVTLMRKKGYDGIDLDMEGSLNPEGYAHLAMTIRSLLKPEELLSTAVSCIPSSKYTDSFLAACDWVNIMLYDMKGSWPSSPVGNHAGYEDFVTYSTQWSSRVSKEKLLLGIPLYGRTFADPDTDFTVNNKNYGVMRIWQKSNYYDNGITYEQICDFFPDSLLTDTTAGDFEKTIDDLKLSDTKFADFDKYVCGDWSGKNPIHHSEMLGRTYFSGPKLSAEKTQWALDNGYAGMVICKLGQDGAGERSIIKSVKKTLTENTDISLQTTVSKPVSSIVCRNGSLVVSGSAHSLSIYSVQGKLLAKYDSAQLISSHGSIELPQNLSCGMYIYSMNTEGQSVTGSFAVK